MEATIICNPQNLLKKQVSPSEAKRNMLREEYASLLSEALIIITEFDVRNNNGIIIEHGYSVIETILIMERAKKDTSEPIKLIGLKNWDKLKIIWQRMREIEALDKHLILDK